MNMRGLQPALAENEQYYYGAGKWTLKINKCPPPPPMKKWCDKHHFTDGKTEDQNGGDLDKITLSSCGRAGTKPYQFLDLCSKLSLQLPPWRRTECQQFTLACCIGGELGRRA